MTTILITSTRIYTDSNHFASNIKDESFHSLTKIKKLKEPAWVKWTPVEERKVDDDINCPAFVDQIHGYTVTGNNKIADLMIKRLEVMATNSVMDAAKAVLDETDDSKFELIPPETYSADLNVLYTIYQGIADFGYVNNSTNTSIILIGEKACYNFTTYIDGVGLGIVKRDNPTAYGSGAEYASKFHYVTGDPIRAVYNAMWYDSEQTGGMIDIWHLPTEEDPRLYREGVCNARPLREIKGLIHGPHDPDKNEPMMPDLISYEIHCKVTDESVKLAEQTGYDRGIGKLEDPQNRRAKALEAQRAAERVRNTLAKKVKKPVVPPLKSRKTTKSSTAQRRKPRT